MLPRLRFAALLLATLAGAAPAQTPAGTPTSVARRSSAAPLMPGDQVVVRMWLDKPVTETVVVGERGEIVLPKLGVVNVFAFTIGTMQDSLRARYAAYLRDPAVDVSVLRRVVVNGAVARPDVYLVDVTSSVRDVIARAGGITEAGSASRVSIIRNGEKIPVKDWERDQSSVADLRSGDQVYVGHSSWISRNLLSVASVVGVVWSIIVSIRR